MTHYACLNLKPVKATELSRLLHHNIGDRSNLKNVDNNRTQLNSSEGDYDTVKDALPTKNKQGNKLQKNAIVAVSLIFQASHGWRGDSDKLFADAQAWLVGRFDGEIAHWAVHRDEETPHIHVMFVPKNSQGRANFRDQFSGTKNESAKKLRAMLESYYTVVGDPLGLARGKSRKQREAEGTVRHYGGGAKREREERLRRNKELAEVQEAREQAQRENERDNSKAKSVRKQQIQIDDEGEETVIGYTDDSPESQKALAEAQKARKAAEAELAKAERQLERARLLILDRRWQRKQREQEMEELEEEWWEKQKKSAMAIATFEKIIGIDDTNRQAILGALRSEQIKIPLLTTTSWQQTLAEQQRTTQPPTRQPAKNRQRGGIGD